MGVRTFIAETPLLDLDMQLGEGCVWDSKRQCLFFVDIDKGVLYAYDPAGDLFGYRGFDRKLTSIALSDDDSMVATLEDCVVQIKGEDLPRPELRSALAKSISFTGKSTGYNILQIRSPVTLSNGEARLNEGAVDPRGRFLYGSMTFDVGSTPSRLYSLRRDSASCWYTPIVHEKISVTNGMAWVNGGKQMLFTDSHPRVIQLFDYDISTGMMSVPRVFSSLPDSYGYPDGLCLDDQGGVWSARWDAGKVLRLDPKTGDIDVEIVLPNSWNITCCIFGGPDLADLYITTAACDQGAAPPSGQSEAGKLYVVRNTGFKGTERGRFTWGTIE